MQYLGYTCTKNDLLLIWKFKLNRTVGIFYLLKLTTLSTDHLMIIPSDLCQMAVSCSCLYPFLRTAVLCLKLTAPIQKPGHFLSHCNCLSGWCPSAIQLLLEFYQFCGQAWCQPVPELSDGLSHLASRKTHDSLMTPRLWLECHQIVIPRL